MTIASWWETSLIDAFKTFAHSGRITDDFLSEIQTTIIRTERGPLPDSPAKDEDLRALAALSAYVRAVAETAEA